MFRATFFDSCKSNIIITVLINVCLKKCKHNGYGRKKARSGKERWLSSVGKGGWIIASPLSHKSDMEGLVKYIDD